MDFFQAQDSARKKSKLLVFYFACAVVMIVGVIYLVGLLVAGRVRQTDYQGVEAASSWPPNTWWQPDILLFAAGGTIAVIAAGSLFKTLALRRGGGVVARSLGGTRLSPDATDPRSRRLLNVVEEMAIASGVRVPEVYLLPEAGINAFAAGYSPDDAAVAVTSGALETLSRDELQGVIAHEFSHILNGDMRLNIRLIGLLFGILLLAVIGRGVMQSMRFQRMAPRGRGRNSGGGALAIFALGAALMLVGYIGVFFGRLIQAAVSRQREFLADASAVQFTRNPGGIAGALKKIGGLLAGSQVANPHAAEASHLFFANALRGSALNLFATHPPLVERIRAIDPSFDGKFERVAGPPQAEAAAPTRRAPPAGPAHPRPPPLRPEHFVRNLVTAAAAAQTMDSGSELIHSIPAGLREAARNPAQAGTVVLGLLLTPGDEDVFQRQKQAVSDGLGPDALELLAGFQSEAHRLPARARLPLVDLALPAIRTLPADVIERFLGVVRALVEADGRTTLFEFSLLQVVERYLRPRPTQAGPGNLISSFDPLASALGTVLSLVAHAGSNDPAAIQRAFSAAVSQLGPMRAPLELESPETFAPQHLTQALSRLERAAPSLKRRLLEALARAAAADAVIMPAEVETLRAVAAALGCPAPPLAA